MAAKLKIKNFSHVFYSMISSLLRVNDELKTLHRNTKFSTPDDYLIRQSLAGHIWPALICSAFPLLFAMRERTRRRG
jgi:hypothetical protein